jgi:hypothetical protein
MAEDNGSAFKVVYVARFKQGMPRDEARHFWTHVHAPKAEPLTDLFRYHQSHVIGTIGAQGLKEGGSVPFDGYSCEWWTDEASFEAGMKTDAWQEVLADGPDVFEMESLDGMAAHLEERVIIDGPTSPFKVVWFAKFKPDMPFDDAQRHWLEVHAEIAKRAPGIDRYVQNLVRGAIGMDGATDDPVRFDGFSECWYADEAAYVHSQESAAWDELFQDGFNFLDMEALEGMSAVLDERQIKP